MTLTLPVPLVDAAVATTVRGARRTRELELWTFFFLFPLFLLLLLSQSLPSCFSERGGVCGTIAGLCARASVGTCDKSESGVLSARGWTRAENEREAAET